MKIKQQFLITETKNRGLDYTLTIYENKGKGKIVKIGSVSANLDTHYGKESEAWIKIIELKALRASIKKALKNPDNDLIYYSWQFKEEYGVEIKLI